MGRKNKEKKKKRQERRKKKRTERAREGGREGRKAERRFPLPLARLLEGLRAKGQPRPGHGKGQPGGTGLGQERGPGQPGAMPRSLRETGSFVQREPPSAAPSPAVPQVLPTGANLSERVLALPPPGEALAAAPGADREKGEGGGEKGGKRGWGAGASC